MGKSVVYVKFINNNTPSDKTYKYLADDSVITPFIFKFYDKLATNYSYVKFKIENKSGYNYRNSDIIFVGIRDATSGDLSENLVEIVKITPTPYNYYASPTQRENFIESIPKSNFNAAKIDSSYLTGNAYSSVDPNMIYPNGCNSIISYLNPISITAAETAISNKISDLSSSTSTVHIPDIATSSGSSVVSEIEDVTKKLEEKIEAHDKILRNIAPEYENMNKKEKNNMFDNITKNLKFGKVADVRMSIYGPAFVSNDNTWMSYDVTKEDYVDVTDLLLDMDSYCYMMPVAADSVCIGDYILHLNRWARVIDIDKKSGRMSVEVMFRKEIATIIPTRSPFGFNFYTKLIPLMGNFMTKADQSNPFGMLPLFMMMKEDSDDMLPLMLMTGGFNGIEGMNNPFMLMALFQNDGKKDKDGFMKAFLINQMMQNMQKMQIASNEKNGFGFNFAPTYGGVEPDNCENNS